MNSFYFVHIGKTASIFLLIFLHLDKNNYLQVENNMRTSYIRRKLKKKQKKIFSSIRTCENITGLF
jgi:hypothetical protein